VAFAAWQLREQRTDQRHGRPGAARRCSVMLRQSPEVSERRSSPATGGIRGQAGSHEQKSWSQTARPNNTQIYEGAVAKCSNRIAQYRPRKPLMGRWPAPATGMDLAATRW